uniref:Integrase catalytic domain-containing protein n=1 Tax=Strongyloides venezuelensis TaxID=75913 RepID=A0A0K0FEU1_STRVS
MKHFLELRGQEKIINNLAEKISKFLQSCLICKKRNAYMKRTGLEFTHVNLEYPNECWALDLMNLKRADCKYVLLVIDTYSRYIVGLVGLNKFTFNERRAQRVSIYGKRLVSRASSDKRSGAATYLHHYAKKTDFQDSI